LSACSGPSQQRTYCADDAHQHFAVVELSKLWKAPPLGDHETNHILASCLVDLAHKQIDDPVSQHSEWEIGFAHRLDCADYRCQHRADEFLKQRLLVPEVEIDCAFGDGGAPRHIIEARGLKPAD